MPPNPLIASFIWLMRLLCGAPSTASSVEMSRRLWVRHEHVLDFMSVLIWCILELTEFLETNEMILSRFDWRVRALLYNLRV